MIPATISASSLTNWHDCPAKFKAASLDRIPETGRKDAARLGKVLHRALQIFVYITCMERSQPWSLELLLELVDESYLVEMETGDTSLEWYEQAHEIATRWFWRTDVREVEVLAVEEKHRINVPSLRYDRNLANPEENGGRIVPLSYIWDRVDRYVDQNTGERIVRVTDYKSIHVPPPDMLRHIQSRIYAMAAMIHFKNEHPDKIVITLDLLRFQRPMIAKFTVEQTVEIWRDLRKTLQVIIDTPEDKATRNLGPGCRYCPISATCAERGRNLVGGGIASLSLAQQVALRKELESQLKADKALADEIDLNIKGEAVELDALEFEEGRYGIEIVTPSFRDLDEVAARGALGLELYGSLAPIRMKLYDELMRPDDDRLTPAQKEALARCVSVKFKSPGVKITAEED